jgi:hypothetical protein
MSSPSGFPRVARYTFGLVLAFALSLLAMIAFGGFQVP